jgi:hypothetical protein
VGYELHISSDTYRRSGDGVGVETRRLRPRAVECRSSDALRARTDEHDHIHFVVAASGEPGQCQTPFLVEIQCWVTT